jgi:DNA-binding SARP family transcriptional activator
MLQFRVLGTVDVVDDGRICTPTPPKVLRVLALLLLNANQLVPVDSLIEELWDDSPPKSAMTTAQTYVYQLRKAFATRTVGSGAKEWLATRPRGYILRVEPEQLDVERFQALSDEGQLLLERGEYDEAGEALRGALALWTGPPLANVTLGPLLESHAVHLEERRLRTLELRIQADMHRGRHRELVGELRQLVAKHPLHEWFHGQLMIALTRSGRRNEALQTYDDLRYRLKDQLGLDPQADLQQLQREVLT